jgi:hypothetical protein
MAMSPDVSVSEMKHVGTGHKAESSMVECVVQSFWHIRDEEHWLGCERAPIANDITLW